MGSAAESIDLVQSVLMLDMQVINFESNAHLARSSYESINNLSYKHEKLCLLVSDTPL